MVHVEQDPRHDLDASPLSTVLGYDLERSLLRRRLTDLGAKLEEAAQTAEVAAPGEKAAADRHAARVQKRREEAEALLAELGDEEVAEAKAASILAGLQFSSEMMSAPLRTLSGGWRMRVTLAAALFVPCDVRCRSTLRPRPFALRPPPRDPETPRPRDTEQILLLDEPTNHLDFPALAWLTRWLQDKCKATLLIVSNPNPDPSPNPNPRPSPSPSPIRTLTRRRCSSSPTTAASSTTWSRTSCSCVGAT